MATIYLTLQDFKTAQFCTGLSTIKVSERTARGNSQEPWRLFRIVTDDVAPATFSVIESADS